MFDLTALAETVAAHGRVARVVIAGFKGSSPREVGAAMLVWQGGQSGTIGGGALEWQAARRAREQRPQALLDGAVKHGPASLTGLGRRCRRGRA